jgi:hypothetical protein
MAEVVTQRTAPAEFIEAAGKTFTKSNWRI